MLDWNEFSSSEYPGLPNASHHFCLIRITFPLKQMLFQAFQAGHHGCHLGYWNGTNLAILKLHVTPMPPSKFWLNLTSFGSSYDLKIFKMATMGAILDIGTKMILAILNLYVAPMSPIKFQLNPAYSLKDVI